MAATYLAVVKAEYEYTATNEEELSVSEDQVLYVLEYTDDDWWKVRVKQSPAEGLAPSDAPTGLVPATYVTPLEPVKRVTALYDYEATSEEEISIREDVQYEFYEEDGDWTLVGAIDKKEVGYAPTAYLEDAGEGGAAPATNGHTEPAPAAAAAIPAPPPPPPAPPAPPLPGAAAASASKTTAARRTNGAGDKVVTWSGVSEHDGKKKKKGTLGVGNGSLFFASESDKAPVQKKDLSILKDITTEKNKQIKLTFTNREILQFTVPKDDLEAIVAKIEGSRDYAQCGEAQQQDEEEEEEEDTYIPPPPPPPPTAGGAKGFGFLPPPPRRMVSSDEDDSDDEDDNIEPPPSRGPAAIPAAPPPPPAPTFSPPPAAFAPPAARSIPQAPPAPATPSSASTGSGKKARAEYDFSASEPEELSITEGETLYVLDDSAEDWWKVRNERGEEGEVPASYVELQEDDGSGAGASTANVNDDEEAARRLDEEQRAEARKEKERLRLKKLEEEARGLGTFSNIQPPPARKSTASSVSSPVAERAPAAPTPPPPAPPAPPVITPPPPQSGGRDARDHDAVRAERRERHRQREMQRERDRAAAAVPVEKTKPSPDKVRTWMDRTGAFKVDAEFIGLSGAKGEKIRLHKLNGVVIEVPLDKMSQDDIRRIEHITRRRVGGGSGDADGRHSHRSDRDRGDRGDRDRSQRDRDRPRESGNGGSDSPHRARPPSSSTAGKRVQIASSQSKSGGVDWFEWFLNAGCDVDDCERYARNFDKDRIDESIVGDLEASTLRSLGLREGDIIRVRKFIAKKGGSSNGASSGSERAGQPPPTPEKNPRQERERQMEDDEELARKLQEEMNAGRDGSGLFTNAQGGVKNTRRGRPQPKSAPSAASFDSIASSLDRSNTPGNDRVSSPENTKDSSRRPSTSQQATSSGFDDDAWTVKPSPSPSPALIDDGSSSASSRVTPSPGPNAASSNGNNRDLAALQQRTASPASMPNNSKESSNAQTLTDAYLESIGLGKRAVTDYGSGQPARQAATSPAPPAQQQQQQQTGYAQQQQPQNQISPQQTGYYQAPSNGPRPPPQPIPLNQQLLNPLIPTQTGLTGYIPTRPVQNSPMQMMPQQTGYQQQPQQTGYQQPQPTGYQQPQQTGFPGQSPFGNQFAVASPPSMPQQQYGGMMQAQPTGYPVGQMSHLSIQPTGSPYQNVPSPQPHMQMQIPQAPPPPPMPPIQQPQPTSSLSSSTTASSSSSASDFQPSNIFAQMKAGQFAKPDVAPQQEQKYDALRPQQTSFGGPQQQPQPQMGMGMGPMGMAPTGYGMPQQQTFMQTGMPQQQPIQSQPTGFAPGGYMNMPPQQQPMMYTQQTGYPYRPY